MRRFIPEEDKNPKEQMMRKHYVRANGSCRVYILWRACLRERQLYGIHAFWAKYLFNEIWKDYQPYTRSCFNHNDFRILKLLQLFNNFFHNLGWWLPVMDMILKRVPGARSCMCIKIYTRVFSRFHGDNDERFWGIFWDMYTSICFTSRKWSVCHSSWGLNNYESQLAG